MEMVDEDRIPMYTLFVLIPLMSNSVEVMHVMFVGVLRHRFV